MVLFATSTCWVAGLLLFIDVITPFVDLETPQLLDIRTPKRPWPLSPHA